MVLKVTRLRTRGFTCKCVPFVDPFCDGPFWMSPGFPFEVAPLAIPRFGNPSNEVFCDPIELPLDPLFENDARMVAGGSPARADCGYRPRSATSIEDASKSLPTM